MAKARKRKLWIALYALAAALLACGCGVFAYLHAMDSRASGVQPSPAADGSPSSAVQYDAQGFAVVDWGYWQNVNPAIVGWVNVPGTGISQPICRADAASPDYWNSHDVYGDLNFMGCPFLDTDCEGGLEGAANAVVQGHNVSGAGSGMFADFEQFADADFAKGHRVLLQTPGVKMTLAPFCVEVISNAGQDDSLRTSFESQADFERYVSERMQAGTAIGDAPASQMWTFSTCSYFLTPQNERTVVHCKLVSKTVNG